MTQESIDRRINSDVFFVHNCFGSFFRGVLDWFSNNFYTRFNYKVIGTYDKSIEFFNKKKELGHEVNAPILPSITLDPIIDFSNEERGGRFLWQHASLAPGLAVRMWSKIDLKEQDVIVTPAFSRYEGTFEVTFWLSSIHELMDFRTSLFQFCGGFNRYIRPEYFWSHIIMPDEIVNFTNENGEQLDWGNTIGDIVHVQTTNQHKFGIPVPLDPIWKLESCNDSSDKYGSDNVAEYKLSASFKYELNLPTFVILSNKVDPDIKFSFSLGNAYTKYPSVNPSTILKELDEDDEFAKYRIKTSRYFRVSPEDECSSEFIELTSNSLTYPDNSSTWNSIKSGKLVKVDDLFIDSGVKLQKDEIIYLPVYNDKYLPYLRRAAGVITENDRKESIVYKKCELLRKPFISGLTSDELDFVIDSLGSDITIDPVNKKIYKDKLDSEELSYTDDNYGSDILSDIKEEYPDKYNEVINKYKSLSTSLPNHIAQERVSNMRRRLLTDSADGSQILWPLGFTVSDDTVSYIRVYVDDEYVPMEDNYTIVDNNSIKFSTPPSSGSSIYLGGRFMVLTETTLIGVYEFTEDDICSSEDLVISLPSRVTDSDRLILISYGGQLVLGEDYTLNIEEQTITLLIEPKTDEIVEFFYYQ